MDRLSKLKRLLGRKKQKLVRVTKEERTMEKILYTEIKRVSETITEKTVLYENSNRLYVWHVRSSGDGKRCVGCYRPANLRDHHAATLALVEQLQANFTH